MNKTRLLSLIFFYKVYWRKTITKVESSFYPRTKYIGYNGAIYQFKCGFFFALMTTWEKLNFVFLVQFENEKQKRRKRLCEPEVLRFTHAL